MVSHFLLERIVKMATKKFYHDIDLVGVGQLLNTRLQNVTSSQEDTLASSLGQANKGLVIYNSEDGRIKTWDGEKFDPFQIDVDGDVKFKGVVDASADAEGQIELVSGSQYVVSVAGTLAFSEATVSITPSASVEVGDIVLVTAAGAISVIQRNDVIATETVAGNIRLATSAQAIAGEITDKAITPKTLADVLEAKTVVSSYNETVSLTAGTAKTIEHAFGLTNANAFVINAVHDGSVVSLDVDVVDGNNITVTSFASLTAVDITIHAFKE
jgi:hypothetical protein